MTVMDKKGVPFHEIVIRRMLCELSIVGILKELDDEAKPFTKDELLEELAVLVDAERKGIAEIGRKEAAKIYGLLEGRRSSMATVDFVLKTDFVGHYRDMV